MSCREIEDNEQELLEQDEPLLIITSFPQLLLECTLLGEELRDLLGRKGDLTEQDIRKIRKKLARYEILTIYLTSY
jgi:hypothetical protein